MRRSDFDRSGGFKNLPIMEDYEFIRRLRRRGLVKTASLSVTTSPRRWEQLGFLKTTLINQLMIAGFHLGISPERLARLYRRNRFSV
jgi:hypothetical protein